MGGSRDPLAWDARPLPDTAPACVSRLPPLPAFPASSLFALGVEVCVVLLSYFGCRGEAGEEPDHDLGPQLMASSFDGIS